jgi:asparagine synthase (glutamine-hydrolysing)
MLNHIFGLCDVSGNSEAYNLVQSRLLDEARLLGSQFTVEINDIKRIGLISNNYLPGKASPGKSTALCGDLVSPTAEALLNKLTSVDPKQFSESFQHLLTAANGTFAIAVLSDELWIATDFLGARAVYYGQQDGMMIFGTSFDVVKRILPNKCRLDTQALGEDFSFGYPLGDRTLAQEIKVLRGGQFIRCHRGAMDIQQYETFPVEAPEFETLEISLKESTRALKTAILERIQPGQAQASLLSGGLDSRIIVSELIENGQEVVAANYSLAGTHDRIYAEAFSKIAGISLHINELQVQHHSLSPGDVTSFSLHAAQAGLPLGKIFSGDGGGELFGFIDLNNEVLKKIEAGDAVGATACMVQQEASDYIAGEQLSKSLTQICIKGLDEELYRIKLKFSARKIFVAYIASDLRAHLHQYFSSLDSKAQELLLPFYDRRVIHAAVRNHKVDSSQIGHRFYYQLLENLSPLIKKTPWQSYPGSMPCPILDKNNTAISQWDYARNLNKRHARHWALMVLNLISSMQWPVSLRRHQLRAMAILAFAGLYTESYVFKQTLRINRYFENFLCDDRSFDGKPISQ